MNKKQYSLIAAMCLVPSITLADFYVGLGAQYQVMPIDNIDVFDPYTTSRYNFEKNIIEDYEVEFGDVYQDSSVGANLIIGYQFDESMAVEFSYFNSDSHKKLYSGELDSSYIYAKSDIDTESFKLNMVGTHKLESTNNLSLLGSAGIVYQDTDITRTYARQIVCAGGVGCSDGVTQQKKSFHDTDLQLGAGLLYEVSDQFDVRGMIHVVPDGFSFGNKTPYSVNAEVLYKF